MARSLLLDLIDGYESPDGEISVDGQGKRFFSRDISGSATSGLKRRSTGRMMKFGSFLIKLLTYTKAKVYGALSLTFGLLTLVIHFFKDYFGLSGGVSTSALVVGAVFSILAVPLMLFDKPVPIMLQDSSVLDFVFFEFFCIQRVHRGAEERSMHVTVAVVLGALLGVLTYFVHPLYVASGICILLFTLIAFQTPEFSFFVSLLIFPYLSYIPNSFAIFSFIVILTAISFGRKVVYGKRVISFEQYDILIFALMAMILISGIFIKGIESFTSSAALCVMSLGYFLSSNIIRNRRLADRAMNAIVVSSAPAAIISVSASLTRLASGASLVELIGESSTFLSTDIYATFLIAVICFAVAHAKQTHAVAKKIAYSFMAFLNILALILTGEMFAVLALIIGASAYFALKPRRLGPVLLVALFILPYLIHLLPQNLLDAIYRLTPSVPSYAYALDTLLASLDAFFNNFLFGIGIGSESFAIEMREYGITAADSGNLFIELALEAGVLALMCFLILIIARLRHRVRYRPYIKNSVLHNSQPIVSVAIFALLSYGAFNYIFSSVPMFYFFFVVFGIESGMLRVARRECDERALYYLHSRADDASEIDVYLGADEQKNDKSV
ncbi:MAG: hypothetical protein IJW66_04625 [Clostridia bacterium]|nr:hypothetical protein [Clostridia bacterium]